MPTDFRSEMTAWMEVYRLRRGSLLFFGAILVLMMTTFFVMVWEYQSFSAQVTQLTGQVEVITEINEGLPADQVELLQIEINKLPMVQGVEYWSSERVVQYIDERIFTGYQDFLQKHQLDVPVKPLFRIRLSDIGLKTELLALLNERFGQQLLQIDLPSSADGGSFAGQFLDSLSQAVRLFQILMVLTLIVVLALSGYLTAFVLSERSRGFHLGQMLHLSLPYTFWPAILFSTAASLVTSLLALVLTALFLGHVLFTLVALLFGAFVFVDLILVWFGRYVVVRWSLR